MEPHLTPPIRPLSMPSFTQVEGLKNPLPVEEGGDGPPSPKKGSRLSNGPGSPGPSSHRSTLGPVQAAVMEVGVKVLAADMHMLEHQLYAMRGKLKCVPSPTKLTPERWARNFARRAPLRSFLL